MDEKLIGLLIAAKKALHSGQSICEQANTLSQDSEEYADAIEKSWPRMVFVHNHILVQLSALNRIREYLLMKIQIKRDNLKDRESTFGKVSFELQEIFGTLRKTNIDPHILRLNHPTVHLQQEERSTLFDYIQDQAVLELQQLADDEIGKAEVLCNSLELIEKNLSTKINELASMLEAAVSISLDDTTASFVNAKTQFQEGEMAAMADILNSLTNHYDQLGEALRLWRSNLDTRQHLDISVLQEDHDRLPDIVEDLRDSFDVVKSVKEELLVRLRVQQTVHGDLLNVLDQLETVNVTGGLAELIVDRLTHVEVETAEHETNMDLYFDQLMSLTEWYNQFIHSYHHLIVEVERRQQVAEDQAKWRQEIMRALEKSHQEEIQKRKDWVAEHGQFLPEDLCAFIFVQPVKLSVHPDRQLLSLGESADMKASGDIKG
ncbi:hypothetical protein DM01DRAFT_1198529 [Hesseltinella vesiculosa]|uniref:Autophagy-related protein 17 n=1 Tax=Hesseltinella vesiculosa TaxID=101127 RepID=A0A1X2G390_9FUNG|nr:hypothetical protein DM01DRAFT_1198529 [Hesseltinella vesiculosa]